MRTRALIGLFPLAFLLHDLEEILTGPRWVAENQEVLAGTPFQGITVTAAQFSTSVVYLFVLITVATWLAVRTPHRGPALSLFIAGAGLLFLNVWTHLGQSLIVGGYTPGVITAPLIALPYTVLLFRHLFREGLLDWRSFARSLGVSAAMGMPVVLSAHWVGRTLFPG